jgi:hypothetical protein
MSDEQGTVQPALSVLVQALRKAEIREVSEPPDVVSLFSDTKVLWERTDDDIELRISHKRWNGGRLEASISLKDIANVALTIHRHDAGAVEALVAALAYIRHNITTLLSRVHDELVARNLNMFPKLFPN